MGKEVIRTSRGFYEHAVKGAGGWVVERVV